MTDITVYYLEMTSPDQHVAATSGNAPQVMESQVSQGKVNKFLYDLVGESWQWFDKKDWSAEQWERYAGADDLRTFIGFVDGSIAGYFELSKKGSDTEIAYFGLAPAFTGRGIGGPFLSEAIHRAWAWPNTARVILNTCTLDHPSALGNYQKRGFVVYRQAPR
jgi:GNAT superfamily N-acetyltransferase